MSRILKSLFFCILTVSFVFADTTTNMSLVKPEVGTTLGPTWAEMINTALEVVDLHDHSPGKGKKVSPSGLDITGDLTFKGNNATNLKTSSYNSQGSTLSSSFTGAIYRVGDNLYWNNGSGVPVQITSGTAVNNSVSGAFAASTPGAYPYSVTAGDAQKVLLVDTSATRTINLPAATTTLLFAIKDLTGTAGTNPITVNRAGADTIDGVAGAYSINVNKSWTWFVSNGVNNWNVAQSVGTALGSISNQNSNNVTITGGSISGITDLAVVDGGTGASDATTARTNLVAAKSGANSDITSLSGLTWTDYSGTISASGDGVNTLSSITYVRAEYHDTGTFLCVSIEFTGTLSGTLSNKVAVTLPFNSATPYGGTFATGMTAVGTVIGGTSLFALPNTLHLYRYDGANLANGAYTFRVNGCYEST